MATSSAFINSSRSAARAISLLLAFPGLGCQVAFGTYDVGTSDTAVTGSGGSAAGGATSAAGGTANGGSTSWGTCEGDVPFNCSGANLLQCVDRTWQKIDTCTQIAYCQKSLGVCFKCAADEPPRCSTDKTAILTCADPRVGFTPTTTCVAPEVCSPGNSACVKCEPGQVRCKVNDAGAVMDEAEKCESAAWAPTPCKGGCTIVDGVHDTCLLCTDGTTACGFLDVGGGVQQSVLKTCVSNGTRWSTKECTAGCVSAPGTPDACA